MSRYVPPIPKITPRSPGQPKGGSVTHHAKITRDQRGNPQIKVVNLRPKPPSDQRGPF